MPHTLEPVLTQLEDLHKEVSFPLFEDDPQLLPEIRWQALTYMAVPALVATLRNQQLIICDLLSKLSRPPEILPEG